MGATHHSSLITHHSSLITHHSSLITHHSLLIITHHSSLLSLLLEFRREFISKKTTAPAARTTITNTTIIPEVIQISLVVRVAELQIELCTRTCLIGASRRCRLALGVRRSVVARDPEVGKSGKKDKQAMRRSWGKAGAPRD